MVSKLRIIWKRTRIHSVSGPFSLSDTRMYSWDRSAYADARAIGYKHDLQSGDPSVEDVAANWDTVIDMQGAETVSAGSMDGVKNVMSKL